MGLDMFLEILRTFECLATKFASMRLQGDMDAYMRGNVVTFNNRDVAVTPSAL